MDGEFGGSGHRKNPNSSKRWLWILLAVVVCLALVVFLAIPRSEDGTYEAKGRIEDMLQSEQFAQMSDQEQLAAVESLLDDLYKDGLIQKKAEYDETSEVFSFRYQDGTGGGICMREFDEVLNSGPAPVTGPELNAKVSAYTNEALEVVFFNAFEDTPFRRVFYNDLQAKWQSQGVNTTVDTLVTVEDLENLQNYDVVVFSSHGSTYNNIPALCLNEQVNQSNYEKYWNYLYSGAVVTVHYSDDGQDHYWVLPEFFSQCYQNGGLEGKLFCSESCCFFGSEDSSRNPDTSFADAILLRSAEAVMGYRNSVLAEYSRNLITTALEQMFEGVPVEDALRYAIAIYGENDNYADPSSGKRVAYPLWYGDDSYVLARDAVSQKVTESAVDAYEKMLREEHAILTDSGYCILASHYMMFDMNRDRVPEMMLYGMDPDGPVPVFEIYTYHNGQTLQIANSLTTCTMSTWTNSTSELCIWGDQNVYYNVAKSLGSQANGTAGLLKYDGQVVRDETLPLNGHTHGAADAEHCEVLVSGGAIVGGNRIGS